MSLDSISGQVGRATIRQYSSTCRISAVCASIAGIRQARDFLMRLADWWTTQYRTHNAVFGNEGLPEVEQTSSLD
jgi:hypothetical protein